MLVQWVSESRLGGAAARQSQYSREFLTCDKSVYAGSGAMVPGGFAIQLEEAGIVVSSQISQEGLRRVVKAGKHRVQITVAQMPQDALTKHTAEVRGQCKVATLVEL